MAKLSEIKDGKISRCLADKGRENAWEYLNRLNF